VSLIVLLLEPYDDAREMYREFLVSEGFTVVTPPTVEDAFTAAAGVDALVTDVNFDVLADGVSLVERLRGNAATAGLPIVVISASIMNAEVARATRAGCDLFLPKPCTPPELADAVRKAISLRRLGPPRPIGCSIEPRQTRRPS
jgi:CheY-like chemotaxis protein